MTQTVDEADEETLYRELFAGLPVPLPELDATDWPAPAGVIAGREDGALVGWVVFFAHGTHDAQGAHDAHGATATLQWIMLGRERERITTGCNTEHPATLAETATLTALAAEAAKQAREAGYAQLRWGPAEPGFAEGIAARLNARPIDDSEGYRFYLLAL